MSPPRVQCSGIPPQGLTESRPCRLLHILWNQATTIRFCYARYCTSYETTGGMKQIGIAQQIKKWSRCECRLARPLHSTLMLKSPPQILILRWIEFTPSFPVSERFILILAPSYLCIHSPGVVCSIQVFRLRVFAHLSPSRASPIPPSCI
jgi:hypothetical protein